MIFYLFSGITEFLFAKHEAIFFSRQQKDKFNYLLFQSNKNIT